MRPVENVALIGALRTDVSAAGWRPKARLVTVFLPVLEGEQEINLILVSDHMIPAHYRLVIGIAPDVPTRDEVIVQPGGVGRREVGENRTAHGADAVPRYHVPRKRIANESAASAGRGRFLRPAHMGGRRVIDLVSKISEMQAVPQ